MAKRKTSATFYLQRPDGLIPAAVYLRVSSVGQDVENSIEAQLEHVRRWAKENGYFIVKVFRDRAKTGRLAKREDFQDMVEIAESPDCPFAVVLVWRFSRFFRNREESAVYKNRLRKRGVRVISINEKTDDSAAGQLFEGLIETVDEYSSKLISEDVRRGTHNLASRGFFMPGKAPYGMMKVKVQDGARERYKLAPDPKTRQNIRRIFDLGLQYKTEGQISKVLWDEGVLNINGKPFMPNRVSDVLTNRHYEGTIVWGENPDGTPATVCEGAHEGIVTPKEYATVQKILKSRNRESQHPRQSGSDHLLSALGKCRQCGEPYNYAPSGDASKRYLYIVCNTRKYKGPEYCDSPRLPAELFEAFTLDVINEDILSLPHLQVAIEELRQNVGTAHADKTTRLEEAQKRVADFDQRLERLYLTYENGDIDYDFYADRNRELRDLKANAQAELEQLDAGIDDTTVILNHPEAVLAHSAELKTFLKDETPARARAWLQTFLKRYWVEPEFVTYEYSLPLPPGSPNEGKKRHKVPLDEAFRSTTRLPPRKRESKDSWPMLAYRPQQCMDSRLRGNDGLVGPKTLRRDCPARCGKDVEKPSKAIYRWPSTHGNEVSNQLVLCLSLVRVLYKVRLRMRLVWAADGPRLTPGRAGVEYRRRFAFLKNDTDT